MLKRAGFGSVVLLSVLTGCSGSKDTDVSRADGGTLEPRCRCRLDWQVDNLAVCVGQHTAFTDTLLYSSSREEGDAKAKCDVARSFPQPVPARPWSAQRISSACTGSGTLVLRVRQGDAEHPLEDDCIIAEQEVEFDYPTANQSVTLPALTGWSAQDQACARAYEDQGGYLEFRVESSDVGCGNDGTTVRYVNQCPVLCDLEPSRPECEKCGQPTLTNAF